MVTLGTGIYQNPQEAVGANSKVGKTFEPNPNWQKTYAELYERYKHINEALHEARKVMN